MQTISKLNENSHPLGKQSATQKCLQCGKAIRGRSDKKFCDDWCRNGYNNYRIRKRKKGLNNIRDVAAIGFAAILIFHYIKNRLGL